MPSPDACIDLDLAGIGVLRIGRTAGAMHAVWRFAPPKPAADPPIDAALSAVVEAIRLAIAGDESMLGSIPTPEGRAFERRVWECARTIARGETRTYGWVADRIGSGRGACRAVGQALRRNPLPVVVPCHRVVATHGPGGYAGAREGALHRVKLALLARESRR